MPDRNIDKRIELAVKWENTCDKLVEHFKESYSPTIEKRHIFDALFMLLEKKYNLEWTGDLWNVEIEYVDVLKLLEYFDFDVLLNPIETDISIIPHQFLMEYKIRIKSKGLIWVINQFDPDPFPSKPHAHQLDNNIKLDLSNGNCYIKSKLIHTIKKKELIQIREMVSVKYKGELPNLKL